MLDERKQRILQAIINDYISSAEPVGSRTIARKYDLGVSPATIRNEMADLEMLGYLEQLEEEENAQDLVDKMKLFGNDAKALYDLDQENAARVYTVPSPLANA